LSRREVKDLAASVHARLFNLSRERRDDFKFLLTRYSVERLLYRLSKSEHRERVALKGAMLFFVWTQKPYRPTRDVDFLGYGDSSADEWRKIFKSVCSVQVEPDGLIFDPESLSIEEIRERQEYGGQRIRLKVKLGRARIDVQVDVGFGDAVTPKPKTINFPTLLDMPSPIIKAYPQETFIAEKLHTMVVHGIANGRMNDYYDLWYLASNFSFDGDQLSQAIKNTFQCRKTEIPAGELAGLSDEYTSTHEANWKAFLGRNKLDVGGVSLQSAVEISRGFLLPPMNAAALKTEFSRKWRDGKWI